MESIFESLKELEIEELVQMTQVSRFGMLYVTSMDEELSQKRKISTFQAFNRFNFRQNSPEEVIVEIDELLKTYIKSSEEERLKVFQSMKGYSYNSKNIILRMLVQFAKTSGEFEMKELYKLVLIAKNMGMSDSEIDSSMEDIINDAETAGVDLGHIKKQYRDILSDLV